jgi:2-hydroxychromene-2-carboxylate isomerase
MEEKEMDETKQHVRFLFDPNCPWTWRTSLWVREVAKVRPLEIEWGLLSLAYVNRESMDDERRQQGERRKPLMRLLELVRCNEGNDALDRLYLALGEAVHEQKQQLDDEAVWRAALSRAELPQSLLQQARSATELDAELDRQYEQALSAGAIGAPTLSFNGSVTPYFGPVINSVPHGEDAGQLWDHLAWLATQPYFYEFKRSR